MPRLQQLFSRLGPNLQDSYRRGFDHELTMDRNKVFIAGAVVIGLALIVVPALAQRQEQQFADQESLKAQRHSDLFALPSKSQGQRSLFGRAPRAYAEQIAKRESRLTSDQAARLRQRQQGAGQ